MWIGTADQCRDIDRTAIEQCGVPALDLMENAGQAVFDVIKELELEGPILVACGTGNNGGDGFVVARLLKQAGYEVEAFLAGSEKKLSEGCRQMLGMAKFAGVKVSAHGTDTWNGLREAAEEAEVVVDALLGTGQVGEPTGAILEAVVALHDSYATVISVDVPTGVITDTGDAPGPYVDADVTVSFALAKPCFFQGVGAEACGEWRVVDIGHPEEAFQRPTGMSTIEETDAVAILGDRAIDSHKGDNGHVLVVAGSYTMRGAAVLAAEAAYRAGAGMVTVASLVEVCDAVAARLPEALLHPLEDEDGVLSPEGLDDVLDLQDRVDCAIFGPGLGTHESVRNLLSLVWASWTIPCVIDADALNALCVGLDLPTAPCILTPHPGEMARLLGTSVQKIQSDRFGAVRAAVEKYGQTTLLKGAYSITGDADGNAIINVTGNPGMASAGMGDVLAGVVAGLLAQGLPTKDAAGIGAHLHGLAADLCADDGGPIGFLASDVAAMLPSARAKLEGWYQD
ncbi:MAG TPA: NAD(P)H-hydrate dehydratase [Fimbriimonadaceae bacterium]|nr:NAD(P)H-hydrate dehydratase [Fimbriimonadaceae bacterium]